MHEHALHLREVVVFLVAAGLVVPLLRRLGLNPILGFLAVGIAIGPYGLARFVDYWPPLSTVVISDLDGVRALAELGVVFLLFMIGLELSFERLWIMRRSVFGLGAAQVIVTGAAIAAVALAFGNAPPAAVVIGVGFALSSTAIVMGLLTQNARVGTPMGQTAFAILLFQDLAVLPALLLVSALGATGGGSVVIAFATAIAQALAAVAVILVLGRVVLSPLLRVIGRGASRDLFLASVLLVIIGTAVATEQAGLSLALGAFLAGLLFSETEYRHAVEVDIEPFKGLLLALFFVSVGMGIDLTVIAESPLAIIASVVGLFVLKSTIIFLLARLWGRSITISIEAGLLLGQGGEFAFLIIGLATGLSLLPDATAQFMLIVTGISMVVTPLVALMARRIAQRIEASAAGQPGVEEPAGVLDHHVVIVGYGRVGRMLASVLDGRELPYVAIDSDPVLVSQWRKDGANVVYGDALHSRVLSAVGIERATALVVTMDSASGVERVVEAVAPSFSRFTDLRPRS